MNKTVRNTTLLLTILLVLAISAFMFVPVLADSGTTAPTPAPSSGGRTSNKGSSSNSLSQVPNGTKVLIVNDQGDKLPLGTQAAQDILNSGDPIWCPSGVTPVAGSHGCTPAQASMNDLLSAMGSTTFMPKQNGTIWLIGGTDTLDTTPITIDGSTLKFSTWKGYQLTIRGGWNGLPSGTVNTLNPTAFSVPLQILNWNNNVTLSDIVISGASGDGLVVTTTKNIGLLRVKSNSNMGRGASLDNRWGMGTVSVTSSQFNSNTGGDGLEVYSNGVITLNAVIANSNTNGSGAYLDNCLHNLLSQCTASVASSVSFTGLSSIYNTFNSNGLDGLDVYSYGNVATSNLTAQGNGDTGVWLENDYTNTHGVKSKGTVTLTGINLLTSNIHGDGLDVLSFGAIKVSNLSALNNSGGAGASLDNNNASTAQTITLNNYNIFNGNGMDGLDIFSKGAISLNNLTASQNGANGASIFNNNPNFPSSVTLMGYDIFSNNYNDGLDVTSSGVITVNTHQLVANSNGITGSHSGVGVILNNSGATLAKTVTVSGSSTFNGNYAQVFDGGHTYGLAGLVIFSKGSIKVSNIIADNNTNGSGALLDNFAGSSAATVTLTGAGFFNNNAGDGIDVLTHGTATMTEVNANANQGTLSSTWTGDGAYFSAGGNVTLTCGKIANNVGYGVDVVAAPSMALPKLTLKGVLIVNNLSGNIYYAGIPKQTPPCPMP